MIFIALSIVLSVLAYKGLDVFNLTTPVRVALAAIPLALTLVFGLFGFMGAVAATVSLYMKPS